MIAARLRNTGLDADSTARAGGLGAVVGFAAGALLASAALVTSPFAPSHLFPAPTAARIVPAVTPQQPLDPVVLIAARLSPDTPPLPVPAILPIAVGPSGAAPRAAKAGAMLAAFATLHPAPAARTVLPPISAPAKPAARVATGWQAPIRILPASRGRAAIVVEALPGASIIPPFTPPLPPAGNPPAPRTTLPLDTEVTAPWAAGLIPTRAKPEPGVSAANAPRDG